MSLNGHYGWQRKVCKVISIRECSFENLIHVDFVIMNFGPKFMLCAILHRDFDITANPWL